MPKKETVTNTRLTKYCYALTPQIHFPGKPDNAYVQSPPFSK